MAKIDPDNTEIRDRSWEMWAEGTADEAPHKDDIILYLENEGFIAENIEICYDNMQYFWRWECDIKHKLS